MEKLKYLPILIPVNAVLMGTFGVSPVLCWLLNVCFITWGDKYIKAGKG
jgi:hypothetical protein